LNQRPVSTDRGEMRFSIFVPKPIVLTIALI